MKKILVVILGIVITLTTLVACGGIVDEKQNFIDATVEATCLIFQSDDLFDPALEGKTKDIYKKYGFDADDESAMEALTAKFENDEDVQKAILDAIQECSADLLDGLEVPADDVVEGDDVMEGDDTVEGDDVMEGDDILEGDDTVEGDDVMEGDDVVEGDDVMEGDDTVTE